MAISCKQELFLFILRSNFWFVSTKQIINELSWQYSDISIKKWISELVQSKVLEQIWIKRWIYKITSKELMFHDFLFLWCLLSDNWILSFDTVNSFLWSYENEKKVIKIALKTWRNDMNNFKWFYYKWYTYSFHSLKESLFNVRYWNYKWIRYFENEKSFLDELYISFMNWHSKQQFDLKKFYLNKFDKDKLLTYLNELDYPSTVKDFVNEKVIQEIDSNKIILWWINLNDFNDDDWLVI